MIKKREKGSSESKGLEISNFATAKVSLTTYLNLPYFSGYRATRDASGGTIVWKGLVDTLSKTRVKGLISFVTYIDNNCEHEGSRLPSQPVEADPRVHSSCRCIASRLRHDCEGALGF